MAVDVHEDEKFAQVIVPDDQLSLAIGKSGQNARLAARLTNWKIDIKSETQIREILLSQMNEEVENENENIETEEVTDDDITTPVEEQVTEEVTIEENVEEKAEEAEKVEEVKPKRRGRPKKTETEE